jgi:hypothetical protein
MEKVMPWLRGLVAILSVWRPGSVHVAFVISRNYPVQNFIIFLHSLLECGNVKIL